MGTWAGAGSYYSVSLRSHGKEEALSQLQEENRRLSREQERVRWDRGDRQD